MEKLGFIINYKKYILEPTLMLEFPGFTLDSTELN